MRTMLILAVLIGPIFLQAQAPLTLQSDDTYVASAWGAAAGLGYDGSGNLYAVYNFSTGTMALDPQGLITETFAGGQNDTAMIVARYAPGGQLVWHRKVEPQQPGHVILAEHAFTDDDGNVYVLGGFKGTVEFAAGHSHTATDLNGGPGMGVVTFVVKYDRDGNVVYSRSLVGGMSVAQRGRLAADGSIAIAGLANLSVDLDPDPSSQFIIHTYSALAGYLLVLDQHGHFKWGHGYDAQIGMGCYGAAVDSAGNVYVCGFSTGDMDFVTEPGYPQMILTGVVDSWVAKYDPYGVRQWVRHWGQAGWNQNIAWDVAVDANDDVIVAGHFHGTIDFDPGPGQSILSSSAWGDHRGFVVKLSPAGDLHWVVEGHSETIWQVTVHGTDTYAVSGPMQADKERLLKLDAAGVNQWQMYYPYSWSTGLPDYDTAARGVAIGPGNRIAIGGIRKYYVGADPHWDGFIRQLNQPLTHGPISIDRDTLPDATQDTPVSEVLTAQGGSEFGYTWQHTGGALPSGITANYGQSHTLTLSGTPDTPGTYYFRITLTDDHNKSTETLFTWIINPPPPPPPTPHDDVTEGSSGSGGGCVVAGGQTSAIWLLLAVLSLCGVFSMNRRTQ